MTEKDIKFTYLWRYKTFFVLVVEYIINSSSIIINILNILKITLSFLLSIYNEIYCEIEYF